MPIRLLFVDDDPILLKAIERNMCFEYDLQTAQSGQLAMELIAREEEFAVIIADMKMPQMDGIQFIELAREASPNSIFVMLTGNQDIDTAIRAINQGSVFRFLNKPCPISDIKSAVDAAARQHQLLHAERELLQQTFVGSVSVLTEVIESARPEANQLSQNIDQVMQTCEAALGGSGSWEYRVAGRVGLVGFALMPKQDQDLFLSLRPADPQSVQLLERIANTSTKLLNRIPRLQGVSNIIQLQSQVDGQWLAEPHDFQSRTLAATLLRIATHWTTMSRAGLSSTDALRELRRAIPRLTPSVAHALGATSQPTADKQPRKVKLAELVEGMVLCQDAHSREGWVLLRSGRELTNTMIEKFRLHYSHSEDAVFWVEAP